MYSIPKTGTSTVEYNAKKALSKVESFVVNAPEFEKFQELTPEDLRQYKFVSGHRINLEIVQRLKELDSSFRAITLFRDPADQIVSAYNYARNYKYKYSVPFFFWYRFLIPRNPQASHFERRFMGRWLPSFFLKKRDLDYFVRAFEIFDEIICTDQINVRIPELFEQCGILPRTAELIRRKETGIHYQTYLKLNEKLKRKLERDNALDVALYRHFKTTIEAAAH